MACWLACAAAHAAIAVTGLRGGSSIDLGTVAAAATASYEEVTLTLTNAGAGQYRLTQILSSPLTNERGNALDAAQVLLELSGGALGRLEFSGATPLTPSQTLYTSSAAGQDDILRVIYSLPGSTSAEAGTYTGTFTYRLQSLAGGAGEQLTVAVRVTLAPAAVIDFVPGSARQILMRGLSPGERAHPVAVQLTVNTNAADVIQLEHTVEEPLRDDAGRVLPLSALEQQISTAEGVQQQGALQPQTTLNLNRIPGQPQDVVLAYTAATPQGQSAGVYRGTLAVRLNNAGFSAEPGSGLLRIPVQIEVLPVLSLAVRSPAGGEPQLRFPGLKPGSTSEPQSLLFEIRTNLDQPYEIAQELAGPLTNDEGRQLPVEAFSCTASVASTGMLTAARDAPIAVGRNRIYHSGDASQSTVLVVTYRIWIPSSAAAGSYQGTLTFTLTPS